MYYNSEQLLYHFDEKATNAVSLIYTEFRESIQHVDRMKSENTVHLLVDRYMVRLKHRLETNALEFIYGNRDIPTIDWFQKKIMYIIKNHLQEFSQMTRYK